MLSPGERGEFSLYGWETLERRMLTMTDPLSVAIPGDRSLLIVEDDKSFLQRLARAMETRGFVVTTAETVADGLQQVEKAAPAFAVVDMRLGDGTGLDVISALKRRRPEARGIVLTGYGNIATAVTAVKLGAVDYLSKPADADDVVAALLAIDGKKAEPPENPMSADRVRWEHIQRIYELCGRNVSETARRLNMHRRTLQRILAKRAPK
jgi:two-component system response regulator RegA